MSSFLDETEAQVFVTLFNRFTGKPSYNYDYINSKLIKSYLLTGLMNFGRLVNEISVITVKFIHAEQQFDNRLDFGKSIIWKNENGYHCDIYATNGLMKILDDYRNLSNYFDKDGRPICLEFYMICNAVQGIIPKIGKKIKISFGKYVYIENNYDYSLISRLGSIEIESHINDIFRQLDEEYIHNLQTSNDNPQLLKQYLSFKEKFSCIYNK